LVVSAVVGARLRGSRVRTRQREPDRLKSQFFANVSHEFRSPLTLMIGPLQDALAGDFGPLSGDLARQIGLAVSNAQRLLGLVDQLLDVARIESGRLRLSIWHSNLTELMRRMVESFLPFSERRGMTLSLEAPAEPVEVWHDATQLEKVFSNLLSKLRALTGETPSNLIRSFRLQRAEQLLRAGAGAVSEVAYSVGFKSVSHFSNAFQDRYGERPSAFAARHRG
jgi:signal transduction histidine kinase